jgi:hypothetical protein
MSGQIPSTFSAAPGSTKIRTHPSASALARGISATALAVALMSVPLGGQARAEEAPTSHGPESVAVGSLSASDAEALKREVEAAGQSNIIPDDISTLLPLLLTSPERKQLASDLELSIRQGDLKSAERQLNTAIDMGTLAIVLIDRVQDPGLLASLQKLGIRGAERPAPPPDAPASPAAGGAVAACGPTVASNPSNVTELQEALEREQARGDAIAWELATITEEFRNLQSIREIEATSTAAKATELQESLQRERERGDSAAGELASLKEELNDLRERDTGAEASTVAALKRELAQEKGRGDAAVRDLAAAKEEANTLRSLKQRDAAAEASTVATLKEELAQERARGNAVARELAHAIDERRASPRPQEGGPTPIMFRLEESGVPGLKESKPNDTAFQVARPPLATGTIAPPTGNERIAQNAPSTRPETGSTSAAPLPAAPLPAGGERPSSAAPGSDLARIAPPQPPVAGRGEGATPAPASVDDRLVTRADALLRSGDVSGARLLLERSLQAGNPRAAFLLAETFDPHVLSRIGAVGIRSDAAKARDLYARALALGVRQADERMQALK